MDFKVAHFSEVEEKEVIMEGVKDTFIRWLIIGPNFAMRMFRLKPGGYTPNHSHDWEHEVFILKGKVKIKCGDKEEIGEKDYFAYVPPNTKHQFINIGEEEAVFLCIIPDKGVKK